MLKHYILKSEIVKFQLYRSWNRVPILGVNLVPMLLCFLWEVDREACK